MISRFTGWSARDRCDRRGIIRALLTGQRDPRQLAARFPDQGVRTVTMAKTLVGDYRLEPLFALHHAVELLWKPRHD